MFLVGLAVDLGELRNRGHAAVLISHVSIAVPVFLGVAWRCRYYGRLAPSSVQFSAFSRFVGPAMSITAFPVLAEILAERGMLRTPIGTLAAACAAVDDLTGWSLLALVLVLARGREGFTLNFSDVDGICPFCRCHDLWNPARLGWLFHAGQGSDGAGATSSYWLWRLRP
jgi:Kef-type K+ transport system membrane component KefB